MSIDINPIVGKYTAKLTRAGQVARERDDDAKLWEHHGEHQLEQSMFDRIVELNRILLDFESKLEIYDQTNVTNTQLVNKCQEFKQEIHYLLTGEYHDVIAFIEGSKTRDFLSPDGLSALNIHYDSNYYAGDDGSNLKQNSQLPQLYFRTVARRPSVDSVDGTIRQHSNYDAHPHLETKLQPNHNASHLDVNATYMGVDAISAVVKAKNNLYRSLYDKDDKNLTLALRMMDNAIKEGLHCFLGEKDRYRDSPRYVISGVQAETMVKALFSAALQDVNETLALIEASPLAKTNTEAKNQMLEYLYKKGVSPHELWQEHECPIIPYRTVDVIKELVRTIYQPSIADTSEEKQTTAMQQFNKNMDRYFTEEWKNLSTIPSLLEKLGYRKTSQQIC